jgi:hypothetical protein
MEASAAGLAASGETTQQEGGGAPGADQGLAQGQDQGSQQQTVDFGALQQQVESMSSNQEEMRQYLQQIGEFLQPAPGPQEPQAPDLSPVLQEADPNVAAQRLQEVIDRAAQQRAEALFQDRFGPMEEQVQTMRLNQEADALVAEFPDLADEQVAGAVLESARQLAETVGQPELVGNSQFVRLVYMAGRAAQMAQQQEGAAGAPGVATLEGGGGAGPAGDTQSGETADTIATQWAQRRSGALPKW